MAPDDVHMNGNSSTKPPGHSLSEEHIHRHEETDAVVPPAVPVPPDGGWGWVVVAASFCILFLADGVIYAFGVYLVEFVDYFKAGRGECSWIGSLTVAVTFLSGPIASAFTNKYGCRAVTIAGAVITSFGFILSIFAPVLSFMYFSMGLIAGIGLGLIYLPTIVCIGYHFEKRRAFATGLAACGSGVGTFVFAPLSKWLLDEYGWRGAFLIQAGLILNCCVFGALFRPIQATVVKRKTIQLECIENGSMAKPSLLSDTDKHPSIRSLPNIALSSGKCQYNAVKQIARDDSDTIHHSRETIPGPMYRKDIFYSGSISKFPAYNENRETFVSSLTSIPTPQSPKPQGSSKKQKGLECSRELKDAFKDMTDFSLMKSPVFVMIAISNVFTSIGYNAPYIFVPDRAIQQGIDENRAAFLVSVIGITNTVGRLFFGWLSDQKCINRFYVYTTALTLCGICTAMSFLCTIYPMMALYASSYGFFIAAYVCLTPVILADLFGLEKLSNAFGLVLLFQGMSTTIGPPIVGWVFDATGSYDASFWIAGSMIALSGIMLYFIPCVKRCFKKKTDGSSGKNVIYKGVSQKDVST